MYNEEDIIEYKNEDIIVRRYAILLNFKELILHNKPKFVKLYDQRAFSLDQCHPTKTQHLFLNF